MQIIAFDELKTDYKNPIDQCQSLNPLVLPEYIMHAFFNVLFLVAGKKNGYIIFASSGSYLYPDFRNSDIYGSKYTNAVLYISGEFFSLCLNLPLIGYHIHRYMKRPVMSGPGLYDPTSIMNADVLNKCQREGWIKLAFYLLSFFYYLYG